MSIDWLTLIILVAISLAVTAVMFLGVNWLVANRYK